ncbi:MAG: hypothetical protein JSW39_29680 [Desulfobacterales bacterium]|nr:MAG: hypothetical protein JSW39_29680 [Desulfobacterales bacterium]
MENQAQLKSQTICATVNPGICGFPCVIAARRDGVRKLALQITGSECRHIQRLAEILPEITLRELFAPLNRNPVFVSAEQARCHPACPVPVAIVKVAEVALELALPRDVLIKFEI